MKSEALQGLIRNIFGDDQSRRKFEADPEGVMKQFALTAQEKRAVLTTHAKLGLVTGNSSQLAAALDDSTCWCDELKR